LHYANFIRWSTRLTILPELLWSKWVIWALLDTSKPTRRKCFFDLDVASCSSGAVREKKKLSWWGDIFVPLRSWQIH
jgi:hypothetical protein